MPAAQLIAIADHGGVFLARAGRAVQLEGQGHARNVVARFPSVEAAVACYNSPAYQEALSFAKNAATPRIGRGRRSRVTLHPCKNILGGVAIGRRPMVAGADSPPSIRQPLFAKGSLG